MRPSPWTEAEQYRRPDVFLYESRPGDRFGIFLVPSNGIHLSCVVSGGDLEVRWEHVSVSSPKRVPNWYEMQRVKELFWADDETVVQLHVPPDQHINLHPHTLHLWRPLDEVIPLPPQIAV